MNAEKNDSPRVDPAEQQLCSVLHNQPQPQMIVVTFLIVFSSHPNAAHPEATCREARPLAQIRQSQISETDVESPH